MYCGKKDEENEYIYIAYNMHWDTHRFALPSIGNCDWMAAIGTDSNEVIVDEELKTDYIDIKPRSISILVGKKSELKSQPKEAEKKPRQRKKEETAVKKRKYTRKGK
jgi:glycogen operon protein